MKAGRNGMSLDWTQRDLREGLRCFHSGAFFEAHEHWESVWLAVQEPEKAFLQGLIQVAASFHHFQRGNLAGTVSLLRSALRRLDVYPEAFAGVAVAPLRATIRLWLDAIGTPTRSPVPPLPQLQIASTGVNFLEPSLRIAIRVADDPEVTRAFASTTISTTLGISDTSAFLKPRLLFLP
jgi:hypothetical protein